MALALDILSWVFLVSGSFFSLVGGFGIVRLPEFFSRLHGGGVTDTLGAGFIVVGLIFQAVKPLVDYTPPLPSGAEVSAAPLVAVKLVMILFFLVMTSPASCHALAKSALAQGQKPVLDSQHKKKS